MKLQNVLAVAFVIGLSSLSFTGTAMAQEATRVAVANPAKIFEELKETADLKVRLEAERRLLEQSDLERRQKVRDLQEARNQLRPDSPQFQQRNQELLNASIEYEVWARTQQADVARRQKEQLRALFDKIAAASAEVASQKGFDIVLVEQVPPIPENIDAVTPEQLRELISRRTTLYVAPKADLSQDVIALLNARYVSAPTAAPAAPAAPAQ